jgi:Spy/CpxP family protein refolding chaperone
MRRKPVLFAAAAFAALLWVPALAAAAPARGPAQILSNPRLLARYLRLTPEQVQQQRQLVQALRADVEPLREQRKALHEDLREALDGGSPDACAVGAIVVDLSELRGQIRAELEEFDDAFSAILTPEQLARYEALKEAARLLRGGDDD